MINAKIKLVFLFELPFITQKLTIKFQIVMAKFT